MTDSAQKNCRVCNHPASLFYQDSRTFYKCPDCSLVFTVDLPDKASEEQHYKKQWGEATPDFWKSQVDTLLTVAQNYLSPANILDFGSGSGDMTREFQNRGFNTTPLDPMIHGYLKDQNYPQKFDTVVAVEVVEHLPNLWDDLREIEKVTTDNAIIIFTTLLTSAFIESADAAEQFSKWWYKDDPTHVSFFCNQSLSKIADIGNYDIDIIGNQLFVVRKILT